MSFEAIQQEGIEVYVVGGKSRAALEDVRARLDHDICQAIGVMIMPSYAEWSVAAAHSVISIGVKLFSALVPS